MTQRKITLRGGVVEKRLRTTGIDFQAFCIDFQLIKTLEVSLQPLHPHLLLLHLLLPHLLLPHLLHYCLEPLIDFLAFLVPKLY